MSDWSSDVCSSDLHGRYLAHRAPAPNHFRLSFRGVAAARQLSLLDQRATEPLTPAFSFARAKDIALSDPQPLSFQDLILTLQHYWSERGCVILQPYDLEMGAGTFHPATTLRALGPNHWKAAYVQPSRRPPDGRSAEKDRKRVG